MAVPWVIFVLFFSEFQRPEQEFWILLWPGLGMAWYGFALAWPWHGTNSTEGESIGFL